MRVLVSGTHLIPASPLLHPHIHAPPHPLYLSFLHSHTVLVTAAWRAVPTDPHSVSSGPAWPPAPLWASLSSLQCRKGRSEVPVRWPGSSGHCKDARRVSVAVPGTPQCHFGTRGRTVLVQSVASALWSPGASVPHLGNWAASPLSWTLHLTHLCGWQGLWGAQRARPSLRLYGGRPRQPEKHVRGGLAPHCLWRLIGDGSTQHPHAQGLLTPQEHLLSQASNPCIQLYPKMHVA